MTTRKNGFDAASVSKQINELTMEFGRIEGLLEDALREREVIQAAQLPREEAMRRAHDLIDNLERQWLKNHAPSLLAAAVNRRNDRLDVALQMALTHGDAMSWHHVVGALAPEFRQRMIELIETAEAWPPAMPSEKREKRLAELDAKIEQLDGAKAELSELAQSAGLVMSHEEVIDP